MSTPFGVPVALYLQGIAESRSRPVGIEGSPHAGPFPVGAYAAKLRDELRKRARVQLFGEVFGLRAGRARVWFELRDAEGAVPCAMWRDAFEELGLPAGALADGAQVVVAGGPDYYPGSRTASPAFSFAVTGLRLAGEVEVVVVARGGGSLADLFAFCDETLCRTVAMLRVPVIASVGHHTDRTLIDDVAAVSCSTPTHAAETAVPLHCREARSQVHAFASRLAIHARRAVLDRARHVAHLSRAPGEHVARQRRALHQTPREIRASASRRARDDRTATI